VKRNDNQDSIDEVFSRSSEYLMSRVARYRETQQLSIKVVVEPSVGTLPRSRQLKRIGLILTSAILVGGISVGGVAVAKNLLDDSTNRMILNADCGIDSKNATRKAWETVPAGPDEIGNTWELWVIRRGNESAELVRVVQPDGKPLMSSLNCQFVPEPRTEPYVWSGPEIGHDVIEQGVIYGWLPKAAKQAIVTMKSGNEILVLPNEDGYFISTVTTDLDPKTHGELSPMNLEVFDVNGTSIFNREDVMACKGNC
jgi:hypothetical protein